MLSKKDYIRMAYIVRAHDTNPYAYDRATACEHARIVRNAFLEFIAFDGNPRFDRERFRNACGLDEV